MENLFGIPMVWLAGVLAGILVIALGLLGILALSNRILLKLAVRGIPRRPAQTALIIIGLMLSTTIIAASLAIGDTVAGTIRNTVLDSLGETDIRVRAPLSELGVLGDDYLDADVQQAILDKVASDDRIDGALPLIREVLPVLDVDTQLTDSRMVVVAVDPTRTTGFGTITTTSGAEVTMSELEAFEVYLSETGAEDIEAEAGHELTLVTPTGRHSVIVRGIVRDGGLASNERRMLLNLADMQRMMGREDEVNRIDISLRGAGQSGLDLSEDVAKDLRVEFTDAQVASSLIEALNTPEIISAIESRIAENPGNTITPGAKEDLESFVAELRGGEVTEEFRSLAVNGAVSSQILAAMENSGTSQSELIQIVGMFSAVEILGVDELKSQGLEIAELVGSIFVTIFSIFGSFSIIVGMLLIFLVFVMLAAARATEMGIARAIGTKRRHLIQMFTFEGAAYALGASAVGTLVGLGAARFLVALLASAIGTGGEDSGIDFQYSVTATSVVAAFSLGMILTLGTVAISAYRVSKLNIVVAIRNLPPEFQPSETPPLGARILSVGKAALGPFYQGYKFIRLARSGEDVAPTVLLFFANLFPLWVLIHVLIRLYQVISPYFKYGVPVIVIGLLIALLGIFVNQAFLWTSGASVLLIGIGILVKFLMLNRGARNEIADRVGFTLMGGLVLTFWALPFDALNWLTGELNGNIEMFIFSGVWMVASSVWILMYNADLLINLVQGTIGRINRLRPILKPAIAYPTSARFRTGLTVAMFALVIFTMMVFAILNNLTASLINTPDVATGGFDVRAETSVDLPVTDIESGIANASNLDISQFEVIASETNLGVEARQPGAEEIRFLGLGVRGADENYLRNVNFEFSHFDPSYLPEGTDLEDDEAVSRAIWDRLADDPTLAVISADRLAVAGGGGGGFNFGPQTFTVDGLNSDDDQEISSFTVEVRQQGGASDTATRTVIAVVDGFAGQYESTNIFSGIYTRSDVFEEIADEPVPFTSFRMKLTPGTDAGRTAAALQTAFLDNSMEAKDTVQEIRDGEAQGNAFNNLFQSFMGLGLVVGVASLGVVSFRAVVERRNSIGMMRAIGYKSRMIQIQFLIESVFITVLGSLLGVALGAWVSFLLVQDFRDSFEGIEYSIPWATVGTILVIAVVASLITTFLPARQASKIYPSEALRYE